MMRLDFESENLDQRPRDLKAFLEGQGQGVGDKGVQKEGEEGKLTLDVDFNFCSNAISVLSSY